MESDAPTWDDLRVLLAVHRHGSFLAVGRALGLSTSTASRRIDALEAALGRPLVLRTTTGTSVVPDALDLVALAEQIERGLQAIRRDGQAAPFAGTVRISVGEGFLRPIAPVLAAFQELHPETLFELSSDARLVDIAGREADLGIRMVRSSSDVLVERRLGTIRYGLFASERYVARRLPQRHLGRGDFAAHDFLGFDGALRRMPPEAWLVARGAARFTLRSSSDLAHLAAVAAGQGICLLPELVGRDAKLVEITTDFTGDEAPPAIDAWLVCHKDLRSVPRIRAVAKAIEEAFRRILEA